MIKGVSRVLSEVARQITEWLADDCLLLCKLEPVDIYLLCQKHVYEIYQVEEAGVTQEGDSSDDKSIV